MAVFRTPTHFYESLLPTFILSTILGVFPMFPIKNAGNYQLYASKKLHLITISLIFFYTISFVMTVITRSNTVVGQKFYKKRNKVSNFGLTFEFIFGIIILYTIYFVSLNKRKHVRDVVLSLNKVDELLKKMDQKFRYTRAVWYQIIIFSSGILMIVIIGSMQIYNIRIENFPPLSIFMWIIFLFPLGILYNLNSQYGFTALLIYERFKMVNYQLEKMKDTLREHYIKNMASSKFIYLTMK